VSFDTCERHGRVLLDKAATEFANSGSADEAEKRKRAEEVGKSHTKGEDPAPRPRNGAPEAL
jgi:hypothetical protein